MPVKQSSTDSQWQHLQNCVCFLS